MKNDKFTLPPEMSINDYIKKYPDMPEWGKKHLRGDYSDYSDSDYSNSNKFLNNIPIQVGKYFEQHKILSGEKIKLYRGMNFETKKNFDTWIKKQSLFIKKDIIKLKFDELTSWSIYPRIASGFGNNYDDDVTLVLSIEIDDSKIFADFSDGPEGEVLTKPDIYKCKIIYLRIKNIEEPIKLYGGSIKCKSKPIKRKSIKRKSKPVKRKSIKRKSVKRKSVKRKSVKRKFVKRKSVKRKSVKRKSVKRKSVKRKSVKRKSVKRKSVKKT